MKYSIIGLIAIAGIVTASAVLCVRSCDTPAPGTYLPPAEAQAFWTYITETDPYAYWRDFPEQKALDRSATPHGAVTKLYGNSVAVRAAKVGEQMPYGAILLTKNYGKDKKALVSVTAMYKVKGYNPEGGDWFWAKYRPDGSATVSGRVESCIACHAARSNYIFSQIR